MWIMCALIEKLREAKGVSHAPRGLTCRAKTGPMMCMGWAMFSRLLLRSM